ncbi:hypothetical protein, partial [Acutalibacter muris]|uniref:hypothetical protein n=1 Tax=Acutalibacter muris TaxID=1796620 RepID=UPI003FA472A3
MVVARADIMRGLKTKRICACLLMSWKHCGTAFLGEYIKAGRAAVPLDHKQGEKYALRSENHNSGAGEGNSNISS